MLRQFHLISKTSQKREVILLCSAQSSVFHRGASAYQPSATVTVGPHVQNDMADPDIKLDSDGLLGNFTEAYKFHKTSEIARSVVVFKLCSFDAIVRHSMKLMTVGRRIIGNYAFQRLMKSTFYGQFVGGETTVELQDTVKILKKGGIGPMLCVPIEEDAGLYSAADDRYDNNLDTVLNCITLSSAVDQDFPMSQIKLTALIPGELCATISRKIPDPLKDTHYIDLIVNALCGDPVELDILDAHENELLAKSLDRVKAIGEKSNSLGVRLLIDAEYTYLNPALRLISLCMMLKYNTQRPLVAYTYQNYLKETFDNLKSDVEFVRSRNVCFSAKLVRGAYMESERNMASDKGVEDPVHATFDDTSAMYHKSMEYLLNKIQLQPEKFFVVVASHNEGTIHLALKQMHARNIPPKDGSVFFGQLYGMSDHVSSALGQAGYTVYKSTPYGTIDDTIPYLYRRAMENKAVLGGTSRERDLMWKALVNRTTFGRYPREKRI